MGICSTILESMGLMPDPNKIMEYSLTSVTTSVQNMDTLPVFQVVRGICSAIVYPVGFSERNSVTDDGFRFQCCDSCGVHCHNHASGPEGEFH